MVAAEAKAKIEAHAIEHATERLILRYAGRHDPEVVRQTVNQVTDLYATVEVYAFVPVLIERDPAASSTRPPGRRAGLDGAPPRRPRSPVGPRAERPSLYELPARSPAPGIRHA